MLSHFRRPQADMELHIDKTVLHPGDDVEARVSLVPKSDFHIRHGTLELACVETYVQTTSTQYGTQFHERTQILSQAEETFSSNGAIRKGASYSTSITLAVPPDALPTVNGATVNRIQPGIAWKVTTTLDVAGARDIRQTQEVTVVQPPTVDDAQPRPVIAQSTHRQCVLTLTLSSGNARSGDRMNGSLRAEMMQDVTAAEVRAELVRVEQFGNSGQDHSVDMVSLERDVSLESDRTREWRFRLDVGQIDVPSLKTEKSSVKWLVKGIVDLRMRTDLRVEQEISTRF